ncbi:MAG: winged helix-turn-helix domain-containing tetratricopeptide repeat protein [Candidatus Dormibacteraceae bacterium]
MAKVSRRSEVAYKFGDFVLNPAEKQLLCKGKAVALPPKVFDTLVALVESPARLVAKDELLTRLWPESVVEEVALAHCISHLRKALRNGTQECEFIQTVPKRGYRFVAAVEIVRAEPHGVSEQVTIAVLPFENLGADAEREYLADGFTEETIAALGQIDPDHLSVIGRTSMMAYKRTTKSLAEIGRELNAAYLIESSVRTEGGRLRITSNLIRARDQIQIWSASYDSEPSSVLEFQRELSTAVAEQIRLRLSPERLTALARRQTRHSAAYDLYLRGRSCWNQLSPATTRRAVDFYMRATELDPNYALAWSGLADAHAASTINGDARPLEVWPRARDAAAHAVLAEPDLAETQTSLGVVSFFLDWDWPAAERAFCKAVALDPAYCLAHRTLGITLSHMRRHEEARSAARRARELEPLNAAHDALSAQVAFNARDYSHAVQFARQATVVDPGFWVGYFQLGQAHEQLGNLDLALDALQSAGRLSGGNSKVTALRGYLFAKQGRTDEAREVLNTLEAISRERYVPPHALALVHAGLGERESAFECLGRAYEARDVHLVFLPVDPRWDALRSDVRFTALLGRCGFMQPDSSTGKGNTD